jgi:hypothetical protein
VTLDQLIEEVNAIGPSDGGYDILQFADGTVELFGDFTLEQLELIIKWMRGERDGNTNTSAETGDTDTSEA